MSAHVPFSFGVVSGEIGADLSHVASVARELGMKSIDINKAAGKSVEDLSDDEAKRSRDILAENGLVAHMVTGPFVKKLVVDDVTPESLSTLDSFQESLQELERTFEIARLLNTRYVRTFSFRRTKPGGVPERILETVVAGMKEAARRAADSGITLLLENVKSCWGNTGANCAAILGALDAPNVELTWDPANGYVSGERVIPEGYEAAKPFATHVHVKDAVFTGQDGETAWECIGAGGAQCREQIAALIDDGYRGVVVVETHWKPEGLTPEAATRKSFAGLLEIVDQTHV